MSDDTKPVVGLVTISTDYGTPDATVPPRTLPPGERIVVSTERQPRSHGQAKTGRMSRAANQNLDAKIAATEIERALEELELTLSGLGLNARDRKAFDSVRAHLELAKRAVRK